MLKKENKTATSGNPKLKDRKIIMAYKMLFDQENIHAQTVLKNLCDAHAVFDGTFYSDPMDNAFVAGERNVVLRILTILKTDLNDLLKLVEDDYV